MWPSLWALYLKVSGVEVKIQVVFQMCNNRLHMQDYNSVKIDNFSSLFLLKRPRLQKRVTMYPHMCSLLKNPNNWTVKKSNLCSCRVPRFLACLSAESPFLHPLPLAQKFCSSIEENAFIISPHCSLWTLLGFTPSGKFSWCCSCHGQVSCPSATILVWSAKEHWHRDSAACHPVSSLSHFFVPWVIALIINLKLNFLLNNPSDFIEQSIICAWMKEIKNKVGPLSPSGPLMDLVSWCVPWMDQWHFWTFPKMNLGIHSARRKRYSKDSENLWSYFRDVLIQLKYWPVYRSM